MNHIKKFEELDFSKTLPFTSISELINYYECDKCGSLFKLLNKKATNCNLCNSKNIKISNRDDWYKKASDSNLDKKDLINKIKSNEEETIFDITNLTLSESVGETKIEKMCKILLSVFISPIAISAFANYNTSWKIRVLKESVINNYIEEMAEYNILDEKKYDINQPSALNRMFKRLKTIKKKKDKYKSISEYINDGIKFLKLSNIFNFRNREDINYIEEEIRTFFSKKSDKEWIDEAAQGLKFDKDTGKVRVKDINDETMDRMADRLRRYREGLPD